MGTIQELKQWINELVFPGKFEEFVYVTGETGKQKEKLFKCSIYTDENVYHIVAIEREDEKSYLGCQVSSRKERPGETWKRGNDLSDGKLEKETWVSIISDIVKYELVKLSEYKRPNISPE